MKNYEVNFSGLSVLGVILLIAAPFSDPAWIYCVLGLWFLIGDFHIGKKKQEEDQL